MLCFGSQLQQLLRLVRLRTHATAMLKVLVLACP
jgi:hypothetical protein